MTKVNWREHFVELLVVFIGITAAFMLNSWRENSKVKALEEKYLRSFESDIIADARALESTIRIAVPFVFENMDLVKKTFPTAQSIRSQTFRNLVVGYYALLTQNIEMYKALAGMNTLEKKRLTARNQG
jgi:hypothetical protein